MQSAYNWRSLLSLIFILCSVIFLTACEEEEDDGPSFKRVGAVSNNAHSTIDQIFAGYMARDKIDAEGKRVCAYRDTGSFGFPGQYLDCWGTSTPRGDIVRDKEPTAESLTLGRSHVCITKDSFDGTGVYCEGSNGDGQSENPRIGVGNGQGHYTANPKFLTAGERHNCVIDQLGVYCWGNNAYGQTTVPEIVDPIFLASADNHNCVIDASRAVTCWGDNSGGQTSVPDGLIEVNYLSLGKDFSCALHGTNNTLQCWGNTSWAQPLPSDANGFEFISAGYDHLCAVDQDVVPMVSCWGNNTHGQLNVPTEAEDRVINLVSGDGFSCAVAGYDGFEFRGNTEHYGGICWGDDLFGQVSDVPRYFCYGYHASAEALDDRVCP